MDDSVILLDDSKSSVEVLGSDMEDGEVEEEATIEPEKEANNSAAKSEDNTNNEQVEEEEEEEGTADKLVFEVKFRDAEHFASFHNKLLKDLRRIFADENWTYRTEAEAMVLGVYERRVHPESPTSPDINLEDLFTIDTKPAEKLNAAQVPSYKRSHADVLDEETEARKKLKAEEVNKCFRPKAQSSCFNCGDTEHSLRECPKPRNNLRIQRARKKNNSMKRYHVETEQRFGHMRPGRISTKTRHAMGFNRGELPFMFYRLRVLGYPPAWLEEAKVQSSGMALFNADGPEVNKSGDEEGETDTFKYDVNKIVEFPGYNVHPGETFVDEFKKHNVPPFQESDSKENFIKSLGDNVIRGYKRKKLVDPPAPHAEVPSTPGRGECDMEVVNEGEDPPLPSLDTLSPPPPPPATPNRSGSPNRLGSPTLEELTAQQEQLLQQLETNTPVDRTICLDTSTEVEDAPVASSSKTIQPCESAASTPVKAAFKASFEGTPLLKFSVYDKLPGGNNFQDGVTDIINFENLPKATGKYEQMKDLLKNVRDKMTELQKEDD
ncbi:hypothetical protein KR018_003414 [Drosophila ironensis]|nr:hypothetical protein KR018_003414 [Drosophila ironensis]